MRAIEVDDAGPLTTVQDEGRTGWAHLGVPRAGALDAAAAALANRLVGNDPAAAVLETTGGGLAFRATEAMAVAVTGAPVPVSVGGRAVAFGEPLAVRSGDRVVLGRPRAGLRSYVAVAGGLDVPPVLGSRATDTLAHLGPPVVAAGQVLPVGPAGSPPSPADVVATPGPAGRAVLRLLLGPRASWFTSAAVDTLRGSPYAVGVESNRVGLRLEGPTLERAVTDELPSEGIVLGAVQVPASGKPLVFLHDHPTTGGYPVVGVVHPDDLPQCAQLLPGDEVRFVVSRP